MWSAGALACVPKKPSAQSGGCGPNRLFCQPSNPVMSAYYRRNLPHIETDGASYFVSFSTHKELVLPEEARTQVFGHCLFENGRKVHMHTFVVMPTHVHLLFTPLESSKGEPYSLAEIMQGIKGASSHSVNRLLKRNGQLWEVESFDRIVRSDDDFENRFIYIVGNPISAGLAKGPDDYRWAWRESAQPRAAAVHESSPNAP